MIDPLGFEPLAKDERAHTRMILDASWSHDGKSFVTVSRDKTAKIWSRNANDDWTAASTIKLSEGISALDLCPAPEGDRAEILALGTESGRIELHAVKRAEGGEGVSAEKIGEVVAE